VLVLEVRTFRADLEHGVIFLCKTGRLQTVRMVPQRLRMVRDHRELICWPACARLRRASARQAEWRLSRRNRTAAKAESLLWLWRGR